MHLFLMMKEKDIVWKNSLIKLLSHVVLSSVVLATSYTFIVVCNPLNPKQQKRGNDIVLQLLMLLVTYVTVI